MQVKTLGVLTGGGDCPGLNPAIKAITKTALSVGMQVVGIRDGWKGLVGDDSQLVMALDVDVVRHIDRLGGTILGTSRTNPFKVEGGVEKIRKRMTDLHLDALIAIGGEDTLGVAYKLFAEHQIPVVGVPKTIDRDLGGTEYTLGFESALQVITDSVDSLRSTAESHSRIFIVEIMGRHAGHLALRGGISAGASVILIPEVPFDVDHVCHLLTERRNRGLRYSIVFVAEGAQPIKGREILVSGETDAFGHVRLGGIGEWLASEINHRASLECRSVNLSHLQRGGKPVAYDRRLGFYFGAAAVDAVRMGKFGFMAALENGKVSLVPLKNAVGVLQTVNVEQSYDETNYWAKTHVLSIMGSAEADPT